jgi:hypothetical protein
MKITQYNLCKRAKIRLHPEISAAIEKLHNQRNPTYFRKALLKVLRDKHGWSENLRISGLVSITVPSCKKQTALCVQTGNIARFYADLIKIMFMHSKRQIRDAVIIVGTISIAKTWGSNIANFERIQKELSVFNAIIKVPIKLIGVYE